MLLLPVTQSHFNMHMLLHDPSVCVFMYGQATESRWVTSDSQKRILRGTRSKVRDHHHLTKLNKYRDTVHNICDFQ